MTQAAWALPNGVSVQKTFLARQPKDWEIFSDSLAFSSDMHHIAYVATNKDGMRVVIDDKAGETYHQVARGYPIFSPVGNRVAYIAGKKNKYIVVSDEKESSGYDGACCLRFSLDGRSIAYVIQDGEKQQMVLNGYRMKPYDMIDMAFGPLFSPDAKALAYVAKNNSTNDVRMIVNAIESPSYDGISEILFSPDSKTIAYIATRNNKQYVIRGVVEEGPYEKAEGLTWSPDSTQLAYIAIKSNEFLLINNGLEKPAGDCSPQVFFYKEGGFGTIVPE